MHFNNTSIDIENLQQKLEGIIKVLVPEYLRDLVKYSQVDSGLENLINQDIVFLLKTRINANKNLQNLSSFILRKYLEAFPLQLQNFGVL
jgi:ubiquinone biosynthesis protein COQ9